MPKKAHPTTLHLHGTIRAFNISPKGRIEGALVETAKGVVQLNFPKHEHGGGGTGLAVGAAIDRVVELETKEHDHPVYRATEGDGHGEARGKIARLNHARHGEVNGVHLDDGTFVHLKPEGAAKHHLRVGESVVAKGERRPGPDAVVLEARSIKRLEKPARPTAHK